jgi:hypothetical protein
MRPATVEEGAALLGAADAFTRAASDFDRSIRLGTAEPVTEPAFLTFAAGAVTAWPTDQAAALSTQIDRLAAALDGLELALPPTVLVVRTSGAEEFGAPYTRGAAIVLPAEQAAAPSLGLLAHELFHVATRHDPGLRDRVFPLLGFTTLDHDVRFPDELDERRITNPDGFSRRHAIAVAHDGHEVAVVPILVSAVPAAEAIAAVSPLAFIDLLLVPVAGGPPLAADDTDYAARVGKNTGYIIHPEEALADNFALLIQRRAGEPVEVAAPELLDGLEAALR